MDAIRYDEITISLVRAAKPVKLIQWFETNGYSIENPCSGIYYIKKDGFFDTQIIVSRELDAESHIWLSSLTVNIEPRETIELMESYEQIVTKAEREYADSVVKTVLEANPEAERIIKEESGMASELWETFKAEREKAEIWGRKVGLQEGIEKGLQEGIEKGRLEVIVSMLKQGRLTVEEAAKEARMSEKDLEKYLSKS